MSSKYQMQAYETGLQGLISWLSDSPDWDCSDAPGGSYLTDSITLLVSGGLTTFPTGLGSATVTIGGVPVTASGAPLQATPILITIGGVPVTASGVPLTQNHVAYVR